MGLFRPSRERRGPDPYLNWKIGFFVAGAGTGITGMAMENDWLVGAAVVLLAVGVALRFLSREQPDEEEAGP